MGSDPNWLRTWGALSVSLSATQRSSPKIEQYGSVDGGRHHQQVAERLLTAPQRVLVQFPGVDDAPLAELHVERIGAPAEELKGDDDAQGLVDAVRRLDVL